MKKRIDLLREQTEITFNHCNSCTFNNLESHSSCEGCEYFNRLRNIGNDLIEMSAKRKRNNQNPTKQEFNYKITVKEYKQYKRKGWSDREIIAEIRISAGRLVEFKRLNGLTK